MIPPLNLTVIETLTLHMQSKVEKVERFLLFGNLNEFIGEVEFLSWCVDEAHIPLPGSTIILSGGNYPPVILSRFLRS